MSDNAKYLLLVNQLAETLQGGFRSAKPQVCVGNWDEEQAKRYRLSDPPEVKPVPPLPRLVYE